MRICLLKAYFWYGMSIIAMTAKLRATHKVDFMIMTAAAVKAGSRPIRPI